MAPSLKASSLSVLMILITIIGDYYVKKSSMFENLKGWKFLMLGAVIYLVSSYGWFLVYKSVKFLTVGAIHSFGIIIMTVILSQFFFREKLNHWEIIGLCLGCLSIAILLKNGRV